jgi:hypothetical protein
MRRIYYASGSITVSDQMCKAVLRYARALAHGKSADLIAIPALNAENRMGIAHLLIGPSSQLLTVAVEDLSIELEDARVVEILEARTKNMDPDRPEWGSDIVDISDFTTFDWDL